MQARELERHGARTVWPGERLWGFDLQQTVDRLSRVTERPGLRYRALLLPEPEPNAAALADGRVYITAGMLNYLAARGSNPNELACILGHELAHTVAQHLVKQYAQAQQQQLLLSLVNLGAQVAASKGGAVGSAGSLANDAAALVSDVMASGYSQEQELEADQLGIRYVIRAGYDPKAALPLLDDFARFDSPSPLLRTHPYVQLRRQYLERYLLESGVLSAAPTVGAPSPIPPARFAAPARSRDEARRRLLGAQKLYPVGSQSWKNLQRQLDELNRSN